MTTRIYFGIHLRPQRTEFWRKRIRPNFFQGRLTRTPVNCNLCSPKTTYYNKYCIMVSIQHCAGVTAINTTTDQGHCNNYCNNSLRSNIYCNIYKYKLIAIYCNIHQYKLIAINCNNCNILAMQFEPL